MFGKKSNKNNYKKLAKADKKEQKALTKELERCAKERYKAEAVAKYYENRMNNLRR